MASPLVPQWGLDAPPAWKPLVAPLRIPQFPLSPLLPPSLLFRLPSRPAPGASPVPPSANPHAVLCSSFTPTSRGPAPLPLALPPQAEWGARASAAGAAHVLRLEWSAQASAAESAPQQRPEWRVQASAAQPEQQHSRGEGASQPPLWSAPASAVEPIPQQRPEWSVEASAALYGIHGWGSPYFVVNDSGHVAARPTGDPQGEIDLVELVRGLEATEQVHPPMIIRFPEIIGHRIRLLQDCFHAAISRYNYTGSYRGVFPVKCNQDWRVVESVVRYGAPFQFGLEAGSKPELLLATAALLHSPGALLICNGYKDRAYVETALLARELGVNAFIVLEQVEELELVLGVSKSLNITPAIGVRAKLTTRAQGHWADTSGDRGKFGLGSTQLLDIVATLKERGMLHCLRLLHFHFGSQISDIAIIKEALREGSHIYAELRLLGAQMGHIDVGGGLGVDYDGTRSATGASLNYSMQNYANDVVAAVMDACRLKGIDHPVITSESGRALASHQSVLVFNVRNATHFSPAHALSYLSKSTAPCADAAAAAGSGFHDPTQNSGGPAVPEEDSSAAGAASESVADQLLSSRNSSGRGSLEASEKGPVADYLFSSQTGSGSFEAPPNESVADHPGSSQRGSRSGVQKEENSSPSPATASTATASKPVAEYLLSTFQEVYDSMNGGNFQEAYNDAKQFKKEAASLFKLGCLSLEQRARADALFLAVCGRVLRLANDRGPSGAGVASSELQELRRALASLYHCNLSLFRSAPDSWAIQQLFPIMPLSRLQQEPTQEATLADLTCDSDGKVARFIGGADGQPASTLRLHRLREGEEYCLGLFLGGVYQEAMGSPHNLFGTVTTVYVRTALGPSAADDSPTAPATPLGDGPPSAASTGEPGAFDKQTGEQLGSSWGAGASAGPGASDQQTGEQLVAAGPPIPVASHAGELKQQGGAQGHWVVDLVVRGESIQQVLCSKPADAAFVVTQLQQAINRLRKDTGLTAKSLGMLEHSLMEVFDSYTYLGN